MPADATTTERGYGHAWQLLCAEAATIYAMVCCLCGHDIDPQLDKRDRWSLTWHHLDPLARFGRALPPITRIRPAHRSCNSREGDGTTTSSVVDNTSWLW